MSLVVALEGSALPMPVRCQDKVKGCRTRFDSGDDRIGDIGVQIEGFWASSDRSLAWSRAIKSSFRSIADVSHA